MDPQVHNKVRQVLIMRVSLTLVLLVSCMYNYLNLYSNHFPLKFVEKLRRPELNLILNNTFIRFCTEQSSLSVMLNEEFENIDVN